MTSPRRTEEEEGGDDEDALLTIPVSLEESILGRDTVKSAAEGVFYPSTKLGAERVIPELFGIRPSLLGIDATEQGFPPEAGNTLDDIKRFATRAPSSSDAPQTVKRSYLLNKLSEGSFTTAGSWTPSPWTLATDKAQADMFKAAQRRSSMRFATVDKKTLGALRKAAKIKGTTVGAALAAAAAFSCMRTFPGDDNTGESDKETSSMTFKVLQSLDMRRFASSDWTDTETLSCHAGSMDLMVTPTFATAKALSSRNSEESAREEFWEAAASCKDQLGQFIGSGFGPAAVRVFDLASQSMEMSRLVELNADSPLSLGRAYSCGVSNAGVYPWPSSHSSSYIDPASDTKRVRSAELTSVLYATSHVHAGSLFQMSCVTLEGVLHICLNTVRPLVPDAAADIYLASFVNTLEAVAAD
eukprot:CAMPEP_0185780014 /NCGR_PEP_ID=MMETSP1174-20130828/97722_1 /TAXON_ID=35687 /ORGANISM="Dictyocha speculum, Strain CCMP1381" /LENGTH=413 /DNA_ID=CAMNT_0028469381 /DNA_START=40 /DNA_END=1281 /DNA_ORIENTATION=-